MSPLERTRRWLPLLALAALGLLALDRLALAPFLAAWGDRQERLGALRSQLDQAENLLDQESRWLRTRQEQQARLWPAERSAAESRLLADVDAWARDAGVQVTSLRPLWKRTPGQPPQLELQVAATGAYGPLVHFLYAVETADAALAVRHLEIARSSRDRDLMLKLRLNGLCQTGGEVTP